MSSDPYNVNSVSQSVILDTKTVTRRNGNRVYTTHKLEIITSFLMPFLTVFAYHCIRSCDKLIDLFQLSNVCVQFFLFDKRTYTNILF